MNIFYKIRSCFPNLIINHIVDPKNKSVSPTEKSVFDFIEDVIIIVDASGFINYTSPSSKMIFGPTYQSYFGKSINIISESLGIWLNEKNKIGEKSFLIKDHEGNQKNYKVKAKVDFKKLNRAVLIIKQDLTSVEEQIQKEIHDFSKSFPGVLFKLSYQNNSYKFLYISDKIQELTGLTASEFIENPEQFFKIIHPKDIHSIKISFRKSFQNLAPVSGKFRILKNHNILKSVEYNAIPERRDDLVVVNGSILEIQDEPSDDHLFLLKGAIDGISESVIITTATDDYSIVYVNDQFLKETGFSKEEVMGKNPRFLQGSKTDKKVVEKIRKALKNKKAFRGEIINYRKNGNYFYNLMTINPIFNEKKEVTHFIGLQRNINYRIKIEKELKESIDRFNLAVKATNDVIWDWDFMKNKMTWYSSEDKIFDFPLFDINNEVNWRFEHIHPEDQYRFYNGIYNTLKEKRQYWHDEYRFQNRQGDYIYILDRGYILYDEKDNPLRMIGAMQDLTERKKMFDVQTNLVKELTYRNKDLQQFSYIVSHNLRSSIARIKGLTALLEYPEHKIDQQTKKILEYITSMADSLDETLKDLSEILKARSEKKEFKEEVNLEVILDKVKLELKEQIESSNAQFIVDFGKAPTIMTLKSYLFSIMSNLFSNAIKYRSPARNLKIEISSYTLDSYTIVKVCDNGMGINLNMQKDKIFGLYKRFHPFIEGKGLGLYLVKTQAESMGGKVEVESIENEGACFKVYFKTAI